jgi:hypothetical protein
MLKDIWAIRVRLELGLDASAYGTHTLRRTKNLHAVQTEV